MPRTRNPTEFVTTGLGMRRHKSGVDQERTERCSLCGGDASFAFRARDWNRRVTRQWFHYHRCRDCGMILLADPPQDLGSFYAEDYHSRPTVAGLERAARREAYQLEMLVRHVRPGGRLVEIGPGVGVFAWQARRAGFRVTAVEMDAACCRHLRCVVGVDAVHSDRPEMVLSDLPPSRAVVLWQVLEHLREPWCVLERVLQNLEVGGVLLIATPNPESLGLRFLGARWPHVDAPRHLQLVPMDTLTAWLEERGARAVACTITDLGARRWNRFAWQRFLMNRVSRRSLSGVAFAAGAVLSLVMAPLENGGRRGSSYTVVVRKEAAR